MGFRSAEYKSLRAFHKSARCVNLGGDVERWYPTDKLIIVEWQPVCHKLDDDNGKGMVDLATRTPGQNSALILDQGRKHLGIGHLAAVTATLV